MSSCVEALMYGSPSPATSTDLNRPFPPPSTNQMSSGSGLLRYRSAPSSVFGEFLCEDFLPVNRPSSPDADSMFARFLSPENPPSSGVGERRGGHLPPPPPPPVTYHQHHRHHQHHQVQAQMAAAAAAAMDAGEVKNASGGGGGGGCSNLVRHSSSPAGLFDQLHVENGYGVMRGVGGYRNGNESRLKRQSSSTAAGLMSQISEIDEESMGGYGLGSWGEEQRSRDGQTENGALSHQLSLPKTSSEMSAIEKFLQFQDSVPCKIRAKRGCATHPRSIAERVRRTRISERMRKLQELVPNMDKQTNTADMLDLAVDYIKDLQKQVKTISDRRANCTCSSSSKRKPYANSTV